MHTNSENESRLADIIAIAQNTTSSLGTVEQDVSAALFGVRRLASLMGMEDGNTLDETPSRVLKAWLEMVHSGTPPCEFLKVVSHVPGNGMLHPVVMESIWFTSVCEHHLLPFSGYASVAYSPDPKTRALTGLSKLARLVEYFAKTPQIQERMTQQISETLYQSILRPEGTLVVVKASHACVGCRGVRKPRTGVTTIASHGSLDYDVVLKSRIIDFIGEQF
jgi:GTP cyclohydrolase I